MNYSMNNTSSKGWLRWLFNGFFYSSPSSSSSSYLCLLLIKLCYTQFVGSSNRGSFINFKPKKWCFGNWSLLSSSTASKASLFLFYVLIVCFKSFVEIPSGAIVFKCSLYTPILEFYKDSSRFRLINLDVN